MVPLGVLIYRAVTFAHHVEHQLSVVAQLQAVPVPTYLIIR